MNKTYIKEIFSSIQGEGLYIGEMQTFIRFCKCNLNCKFCDTDFLKDKKTIEYTPQDLASYLLHNEISTISLTGGEPLLDIDFLLEFLPLVKKHKKIHLETNGTLVKELEKIIDFVDVVATDIKIKSATKQKNQFKLNNDFLNIAKKKEAFVKVVYNADIEKDEIENILKIVQMHDIPLILQPMMIRNCFASDISKLVEIQKIFYSQYQNTKLIPQMHKFLGVL